MMSEAPTAVSHGASHVEQEVIPESDRNSDRGDTREENRGIVAITVGVDHGSASGSCLLSRDEHGSGSQTEVHECARGAPR